MAFGQQTALRVRETEIHLTGTAWTALQPSSTWPSEDDETTPLPRRFAIKVFTAGPGGANRVGLSYDNTIELKRAKHWLGGAGSSIVEPAGQGLTLYGRAKLASGVNTIRVFVTEYGH